MSTTLLLGILIFAFFHPDWADAEIFNRLVAKVDRDCITLYELNTKMKQMTGTDPDAMRIHNEKLYMQTRRKILEMLIEEKIAQKKVRELGIEANSREVDQAIEKIKRDNSVTHEDLLLTLKNEGISYDSYRETIKNNIERARLINLEVKSKIIIRDEEILQYYEQNKQKYMTDEQVHLAVIFLKKNKSAGQGENQRLLKRSEEIFEALKQGEDFGTLAAKYSEWPGAKDGGSIGFFRTDQLEAGLRNIIQDMAPGEVSQPIFRLAGVQIIKLLERTGGESKSLEEVREAIYETLYMEEVNKRYSIWIEELKKNSYTEILF